SVRFRCNHHGIRDADGWGHPPHQFKDGTWRFWTSVNGNSVWVIIATRNGKKYLKTEADGAEPNNLLSLPRCK
ncbi:DUF3892 domain-containing protein, partial [Paracoccus sp. PXZ]